MPKAMKFPMHEHMALLNAFADRQEEGIPEHVIEDPDAQEEEIETTAEKFDLGDETQDQTEGQTPEQVVQRTDEDDLASAAEDLGAEADATTRSIFHGEKRGNDMDSDHDAAIHQHSVAHLLRKRLAGKAREAGDREAAAEHERKAKHHLDAKGLHEATKKTMPSDRRANFRRQEEDRTAKLAMFGGKEMGNVAPHLRTANGILALRDDIQDVLWNDRRFRPYGVLPGKPGCAAVVDIVVNAEGYGAVVLMPDGSYAKVPFLANADGVQLTGEPEPTRLAENRGLMLNLCSAMGAAPKAKACKPGEACEEDEESKKKALAEKEKLTANSAFYGPHPMLLTNRSTSINSEGEHIENFALPKDGWYHIAPKGEFAHESTGLTQVLDDEFLTKVVENFKTEQKGKNFGGIRVDFDHNSYDSGKSSRAAGWILDLRNTDIGLMAKVNWSKSGKEAVEGGDYRFVSPVWRRDDCEDLGNGRVRPMRLDSLAVTNVPNLVGMVPLSNSCGAEAMGMERRGLARTGEQRRGNNLRESVSLPNSGKPVGAAAENVDTHERD